ncbi:hypothetical protein NQZ68_037157 [Dissostichus eleginoides]|nr:hypothetical protein NQZ68_037157 [Dissostichus eleginoides]
MRPDRRFLFLSRRWPHRLLSRRWSRWLRILPVLRSCPSVVMPVLVPGPRSFPATAFAPVSGPQTFPAVAFVRLHARWWRSSPLHYTFTCVPMATCGWVRSQNLC